jgi:hypothetical protein
MERDEALNLYLRHLREAAGLDLAVVCERTKIQRRFVEALEEGRYGALPSNTHLRAFSLAVAQVCGGDVEKTALLVRRVLAASAYAAEASRSFDTPAPAPAELVRPVAPPVATAPLGRDPALAADGPGLNAAISGEPARGLAAASARLHKVPLPLLLALLGLAGLLSYSASWGLERWYRHRALNTAALEAAPAVLASAALASAPPTPTAVPSPAAPVAGAAAEGSVLMLRARRPCWLVLSIDGERLPTITMQDGDKLRWSVKQKAVLLAGNIGALRVWWMGDNWGYLGELGQRVNGLVFVPGKAPKFDKSAALPLPPGIPE